MKTSLPKTVMMSVLMISSKKVATLQLYSPDKSMVGLSITITWSILNPLVVFMVLYPTFILLVPSFPSPTT